MIKDADFIYNGKRQITIGTGSSGMGFSILETNPGNVRLTALFHDTQTASFHMSGDECVKLGEALIKIVKGLPDGEPPPK